MTKLFALFALLLGTAVHSFSQDLIVTTDGDSLNCVITKVEKDCLYFTFKYKDEVQSTLLPNEKIVTYQKDFYDTADVAPEQMVHYEDFPHFRLCLNGGYSWLTSVLYESIPQENTAYFRELKSGAYLGADAYYYISEPIGLGASWNMFRTANSLDGISFEDENGNLREGEMSDDIMVHFIAPSLSLRLMNHDKTNSLLMNLAIGYINYRNNAKYVDPYKITSNTLGVQYTIGYDFGVSENLGVGIQLGLFSGNLTQYTRTMGNTTETINLNEGEYESLSRIDLSIGLRLLK